MARHYCIREADISLQDELEQIRQEKELICIIIIDEEGTLISQVGDAPKGEEFALYSPMVMETTRRMSLCGGFGEPVCNGVILTQGRILVTHQGQADGRNIYSSLLCNGKVPSGLLLLLNRIMTCVENSM